MREKQITTESERYRKVTSLIHDPDIIIKFSMEIADTGNIPFFSTQISVTPKGSLIEMSEEHFPSPLNVTSF